jgi:CheY-specific phosphatase CheX
MSDSIQTTLAQIASDTLEKLAFLFAFAVDKEPSSLALADKPMEGVYVAFAGPVSGALIMEVSHDVLDELVSNMLGLDAPHELSPEERQDALGETINVICGNILPVVAGDQMVFDLEAPQSLSDRSVEAIKQKYPVSHRAVLSIEEGYCRLQLFTSEPLQVTGESTV